MWDRRVKARDKERVREEEVFVGLRRENGTEERERETEREGVLSKTQNGSVRLEREGGFNNFNDSFFFPFSLLLLLLLLLLLFLGEIMAIAILVNLALNNLNIII